MLITCPLHSFRSCSPKFTERCSESTLAVHLAVAVFFCFLYAFYSAAAREHVPVSSLAESKSLLERPFQKFGSPKFGEWTLFDEHQPVKSFQFSISRKLFHQENSLNRKDWKHSSLIERPIVRQL